MNKSIIFYLLIVSIETIKPIAVTFNNKSGRDVVIWQLWSDQQASNWVRTWGTALSYDPITIANETSRQFSDIPERGFDIKDVAKSDVFCHIIPSKVDGTIYIMLPADDYNDPIDTITEQGTKRIPLAVVSINKDGAQRTQICPNDAELKTIKEARAKIPAKFDYYGRQRDNPQYARLQTRLTAQENAIQGVIDQINAEKKRIEDEKRAQKAREEAEAQRKVEEQKRLEEQQAQKAREEAEKQRAREKQEALERKIAELEKKAEQEKIAREQAEEKARQAEEARKVAEARAEEARKQKEQVKPAEKPAEPEKKVEEETPAQEEPAVEEEAPAKEEEVVAEEEQPVQEETENSDQNQNKVKISKKVKASKSKK